MPDETQRFLVAIGTSAVGLFGFLALAMWSTQPALAGALAFAAQVSFIAPLGWALSSRQRFTRCERRHRSRRERINCRRGVHENDYRQPLVAFLLVSVLMVYAVAVDAWEVAGILLVPQGLFFLAARARWPLRDPRKVKPVHLSGH